MDFCNALPSPTVVIELLLSLVFSPFFLNLNVLHNTCTPFLISIIIIEIS